MKRIAISVIALGAFAGGALADAKVSDEAAKKVQAALADFGCSGGKMEHETEGAGTYEVDDAKCKSGQYDFKLDKDMKVLSITRD